MDRKSEYLELMRELDSAPDTVTPALGRARRRLRRRAMIARPIVCLFCVFACFTALVNLSSTAAQAFSRIPGLRELAEAVSFSRSLGDAVENEYVQPLRLEQSEGGITAKVEYLIVDRKQVTVFFRLNGEGHEAFAADVDFRRADGSFIGSCTWYLNDGFSVPAGQLQSATLDIVEGDVPDKLRLGLSVYDPGIGQADASAPASEESADPLLDDHAGTEQTYLAEFDFLLEFDPQFTETGTVLEINRPVVLDGQTVIIETAEVYPSHLRLNVRGAEENTAWLKSLRFYIETDRGERFDTVKNGVSATGSTATPEMVSYRADSTYFHTAKHLTLCITGAEWLDKDMETVRLDLASGTADAMPEGAELAGAERRDGGWLVAVRAKMRGEGMSFHQLFLGTYYDPEGNEYSIDSWSSSLSWNGYHETDGCFYEVFGLRDYPYDEVYLVPAYSRTWTAGSPVSIELK